MPSVFSPDGGFRSRRLSLFPCFPKIEPKTGTFCLQSFSQVGVSAVEDCHFSPVFLADPCEDFVPIRPSGICSGLQPCQQVLVLFLVKDVKGHLQGNCLHVGPLQGGGDVHVHLQEI